MDVVCKVALYMYFCFFFEGLFGAKTASSALTAMTAAAAAVAVEH